MTFIIHLLVLIFDLRFNKLTHLTHTAGALLSIELHEVITAKDVSSAFSVVMQSTANWDGYRSKKLSFANLEQQQQ